MQMYIRGISSWDTAFKAAGSVTTTGLECSLSPDFDSAVSASGGDCISVDDGEHTFWKVGSYALPKYNKGRSITWALYSAGLTATLRHCSFGTGSSGNSGSTHFKGSIWIMQPQS
uniref:Uncharacterized protein n=1 Tax=Haptolina ericina TaxID=156174 RepID=A0A7S3B889_9EUKA